MFVYFYSKPLTCLLKRNVQNVIRLEIDLLMCKLCESICHAKCAGISENTTNFFWNCDDCLKSHNFGSFISVNEKISKLDEKIDILFKKLKMRFDEFESNSRVSSLRPENLFTQLNDKFDCVTKDLHEYNETNANIINNLVDNVNTNLKILSNKN